MVINWSKNFRARFCTKSQLILNRARLFILVGFRVKMGSFLEEMLFFLSSINCPFCGKISKFRVQKSLQKYICNNKRNLFIHKRLNKLSWIICIWIGLSFNWQNQADKAQERNLKRVQVPSSPFSPPFTHFTRPPGTTKANFESFWF